ncbi:MAG: bifunctional phosphopantothenoylcysteine decarboxylase/phosphopantothenate--cysteine ligase CoaBC [Selenomonadaceae bacterium]|nr:bifunctional phosphopantothenoylcysteine decarboxylase/phosphopantothenate--cysteine ligase CoaBC [Selenomonadaceae bacterium]
MLKDKKIILGVTGGIAAYKAVEIASRLKKAGAVVRVVMTEEAKKFVTELTFREITGQPVTSDMWAEIQHYSVAHISLAEWADLVLVAPATANILAKADVGIADDFLSTMLLATKAIVVYSPAMNTNMFNHPATQGHIASLKAKGARIIEPASGVLACGAVGAGRLPEPVDVVEAVEKIFAVKQSLAGKKVLVTAGGTIEPLDPIRFIANHSSGRQGYAIAAEAAARGAEVVLVSGQAAVEPPVGLAKFVKVDTTRQMREAVLADFDDADIIIKAAAVADYRPKTVAANKIKKTDDDFVIELERNPDILKELGGLKKSNQVLVGFAAETQNLLQYAQSKLEKKNLDFIVANDVSKPGAGFQGDTNIIKILSRDGSVEELPLMTKRELSAIIMDRAEAKLK